MTVRTASVAVAPSGRGELEVTDLNNQYLVDGTLYSEIIDWWVDAGTSHNELLRANNEVAKRVGEGKLLQEEPRILYPA